jgi:hypothetical protein
MGISKNPLMTLTSNVIYSLASEEVEEEPVEDDEERRCWKLLLRVKMQEFRLVFGD